MGSGIRFSRLNIPCPTHHTRLNQMLKSQLIVRSKIEGVSQKRGIYEAYFFEQLKRHI